MRKTLVAGNWKLNGSKDSIKELLGGVLAGMSEAKSDVAVCAPYIYIPLVQELLSGTDVAYGSESISEYDSGAYTGEISGAMLKDFDCEYAIVGHSERRTLFAEKDSDTANKFAAARNHGLKPILCVGELLEEREQGITEEVVARQLDAVIELEGVEALADGVIAYEPVWAIGTGMTASPQQAQDVHAFIRGKIAALNAGVAEKVQILYGGSVNGGNADELFAMADIDGGLIGGASLKAEDFLAICKAG
ncbi:triose-phosphate isomerase [Cocleimonas sp. KMM 6892]|uniref:triose-phosphate isomerase n=1 Tax=unclassified Cocleimonas TaxID=2639732 RepID=UPI002DB5DE2E|nr:MULTISPECIES: triose-phosphate isomerase [unclassified Cocleimonas]MEB8430672.1 triose-phosphate isomerase [Cocleimonas sp. KMM 6892]MEC4716877.1 triose-phosphate isomerase [Cocleimonas sp. KMM 6895]MEC4743889.1 triose-phosphate isomerase [Cocleimonas sp. KMM 6896]